MFAISFLFYLRQHYSQTKRSRNQNKLLLQVIYNYVYFNTLPSNILAQNEAFVCYISNDRKWVLHSILASTVNTLIQTLHLKTVRVYTKARSIPWYKSCLFLFLNTKLSTPKIFVNCVWLRNLQGFILLATKSNSLESILTFQIASAGLWILGCWSKLPDKTSLLVIYV